MNLANWVTLLRIPLLFLIVLLMYVDFPGSASLSILLFIFCGITDWLDGYLARKYKIISTLGTFMDALMDKIFMIGIMVTLLALRILPLWTLFLILLVIGREFLITTLRLVAATKNVIIAANMSGKVKTVIQIVSTGIMILWFALTRDFGRWLKPHYISWIRDGGLLLFLYSTYLTIASGISYTINHRKLLVDS
ncbi:MAG: CDP-diacylglycerol--glycerol-3-phosphate 3-phosphatidyltransferase [Puniceicoccales bacterium]|nr:CDP-diacylglycerol--glycerol-3-phosphate 3-phosphatidyltransferase [Puniceicoccales bacterium]